MADRMTPRREQRISEVASRRQTDLTIVLENVHDPHNIGAVLRTCDSVGIMEIFVLHNEPGTASDKLSIGKRTSSGARKWVDVRYFSDTEACMREVRKKYQRVLGTHLSEQAVSLYDLDLSIPVALVFGNEHDGISDNLLPHLDGNFIIPQMGMVQSLNISVACAVTLYETFRQRELKGLYAMNRSEPEIIEELRNDYFRRHESDYKGRSHRLTKGE